MSKLATIQHENAGITNFDVFIGSASYAMRTLENVVANVAATDAPVMLVGESGVGKQVVARRIHELSSRQGGPLVQISCGAVSAEEISNHVSAGDRKAKPIGTVIFDEIAELDRECQRRLLHIIPDDQDIAEERLRARIISTSSQNVEEEVRRGRFRNDLYHRLNAVCLRIPPLRERREDIVTLFDFFLSKHAVRLGKPPLRLSASGAAHLLEHSWPGNIRELENLAIKILAVGDENLALGDLTNPPIPRQNPQRAVECSLKAAARAASRSAERELILSALSRTQWNRKRAARELQISYKSLLYKLKQIGLPNPERD